MGVDQIKTFAKELVILSADWSEGLYDRIHKLTLEKPGKQSLLLSEATLRFKGCEGDKANFAIFAFDEVVDFTITLGGDKGHFVTGLDESPITIEGLKSAAITLKQFFQENPPTMFLLDGCTISGCIHTDYGDCDILDIPSDRIQVLKWENVDYTVESLYKKGKAREKSIQEYIMKQLVARGAIALHSIELYLHAFLLISGCTHKEIRCLQHDFKTKATLAKEKGLLLREKTQEHIVSLYSTREYLTSRYGAEMTTKQSEITRLKATMEELAKKVTSKKQ